MEAETSTISAGLAIPAQPTPNAQLAEEQPAEVVLKTASVDLPAKSNKEPVQNESRSPDSTGGLDSVQSGEKSSAHHDSEYDTASDLEDEVDNNYTADEGTEGSEEECSEEEECTDISDEDDISDSEDRQLGEGQDPSDIRKKVDEDRSNPQYIPKKGTFYEHDDRTADEPIVEIPATDDVIEISADSKNALSASQSKLAASKKWEKASAGDRWSHDRYDEGEQAPKSRSELVSAYGYDIRNEDGPPRARRRRRYARGPTKYERKWEDEDAYFKANNNNTSRRPPKAEDFPELGDRKSVRKPMRTKNNNFREEKENHGGIRTNPPRNRDGPMRPDKDLSQPAREKDLNRRPKNSFKTGSSSNRQQPREFNSRSKPNYNENNRGPRKERDSFTKPLDSPSDRLKRRPDGINFSNQVGKNVMSQNQNMMSPDQINQGMSRNYGNNLPRQSPQYANDITQQPSSSNLTQRLQQLQNQQQQQQPQPQQPPQIRSDPSHVGSIQMHTLATQNQGMMPNSQMIDMQQADATRSKRYSSLRQRTQPEQQPGNAPMSHHIPNPQMDTRNLQQQLHEAQQQQPYIIQPDHANLIQLIQQENLQVQLQKMQLQQMQPQPTAPANKTKYAVPVQQQYPTTVPQPPQSAYYATEYANSPAPPAQPYVNPQTFTQYNPASGIQPPTQPTAPNSNLPKVVNAPPTQPPYVQAAPTSQNPTGTPPQPNVPYANYPSYQNYNTVGGTTYFVSQPHQTTQRANVLPARRPTNPIPILPPTSDKSAGNKKDEDGKNTTNSIDTSENIDHILDNMFVQRAPYQPPTAIPPPITQDEQPQQQPRVDDYNSAERIDDQKKNSISDESKSLVGSTESSNLQVNKAIETPINSDSTPTPVTTTATPATTEEAAA